MRLLPAGDAEGDGSTVTQNECYGERGSFRATMVFGPTARPSSSINTWREARIAGRFVTLLCGRA